MKSLRLFLALGVLLLLPRATHAQIGTGARGSFPGCPMCGVHSYVDWPLNDATVTREDFILAGWGHECVSGEPTRRIEVWYQDYDGAWQPLPQSRDGLAIDLPRVDVRLHYRPFCPNVSLTTGWWLKLSNPPPPGLRRVRINVWVNAYFEQHERIYLVK